MSPSWRALFRKLCSRPPPIESGISPSGYRRFGGSKCLPAETSRQRRTRGQAELAPGKHRLALFHECGAPLRIVPALEARPYHGFHAFDVAFGLVLDELADHVLERLDGQRRISG